MNKTFIKGFYVVTVISSIEDQDRSNKYLWGTIHFDETGKFNQGDCICTSNIKNVDLIRDEVTTHCGDVYVLLSGGKEVEVLTEYLEKIKSGESPINYCEMTRRNEQPIS